jgi:hypothetical protein
MMAYRDRTHGEIEVQYLAKCSASIQIECNVVLISGGWADLSKGNAQSL